MSGLSQSIGPASAGTATRRVRAETRFRGLTLADLGFVLLLIAALVYLIEEGHGNKFFYDEWTWIESRRSGVSAIFDNYNQHLMAVPLAVYQLFFHTIGLDHYRWYRLLATLGHLVLVTAVYLYARRRIGALALCVAVPLAFFGPGWEFILWGLNFGYTLSLALGIFALMSIETGGRRGWPACLMLVAALLCSETAILFAIALGIELTWRERSLRRAWIWIVPVLAFIGWYIGYYSSASSSNDISAIPSFGAKLAAAAAGGMFGQGEAGGFLGQGSTAGWLVLILIVLFILTRLVLRRSLSVRFVAVLVVALGYWALVAYGRAKLGEANASRYVYSGAVLMLLVILESLRGVRVDWRTGLIAVAVCVLALVCDLHGFGFGENFLNEGSNVESAELTSLGLMRNFAPSNFVLDPHFSPQLSPASYFPAAADLHSTGADTLTQLLQSPEEERSAADESLVRGGDLTVGQSDPAAATGAEAPRVELHLAGTLSTASGCVRFRPAGTGSTLDITLPAGGLSIRTGAPISAGAPSTDVRVRRFASGYENDPVVSLGGDRSVLIHARADAATEAWHVRISPWAPVTACTVGGQ